jgi:hypothetical protein
MYVKKIKKNKKADRQTNLTGGKKGIEEKKDDCGCWSYDRGSEEEAKGKRIRQTTTTPNRFAMRLKGCDRQIKSHFATNYAICL